MGINPYLAPPFLKKMRTMELPHLPRMEVPLFLPEEIQAKAKILPPMWTYICPKKRVMLGLNLNDLVFQIRSLGMVVPVFLLTKEPCILVLTAEEERGALIYTECLLTTLVGLADRST